MKVRPIHENLDTSFVNLSALVRYLRRRQFVGRIRVELSGYEADIYLNELNSVRAREHDRISGRIAEGEEALQRILIRSREPGGIVNVYQAISEENGTADKKVETKKIVEAQKDSAEVNNSPKLQPVQNINSAPVKSSSPPTAAATMTSMDGKPKNLSPDKSDIETQPVATTSQRPKTNLPNLPFELSNRFEDKARRNAYLPPGEWQMILNLMNELLETVNRTLAEAKLDFPAAFQKARAEIASDYPFLSPTSEIFEYKNGKISMRGQVSAKLFTASIIESLRRMLEKLGANPKFSNVHRQTAQKILALIRQRKPLYDKYSITKSLEKILGV
jgi:hypothetical protein